MNALSGFDATAAFALNSEEQFRLDQLVNETNNRLNEGRRPQQELGRDDFLRLLITQLSHQDPMNPMEDREFIAQMAQFSTLEQMTNMAADFSRLTALLSGSEASQSLGRTVEVADGDRTVQGVVRAITRGDAPQVFVDGAYYNWTQVQKVFDE
ncbi:MAG: flagellar hook assembly protein FlgD [Treponema sp.]|nr:flagellar hook assembly protein FlgD [Treponema sp.]